MKLHRLKILTEFRGLHPGFEVTFHPSDGQSSLLEPICFVGLNGSGKSNVLEVLSEIFHYLETYHLAEIKDLPKFRTEYGFEIEYTLPKVAFDLARITWEELTEKWKPGVNPVFKIVKKKDKFPEISASVGAKKIVLRNKDNNRNLAVLPARVIGYSSGMNELISNPFIKMESYYYDWFNEISVESSFSGPEMNRLFFMSYDSNKLITICNFLFDEADFEPAAFSNEFSKDFDAKDFGGKNLAPIKEELGIKDLHSFSINLQLRDMNNNPIDLPSELYLAIENLKNCATCFEERARETKAGDIRNISLYFWVNKATKQAFRHYFKTAADLYLQLHYLRLLNLSLLSQDLRKRIKNAGRGDNISAMLPKYEESKLVFMVNDIAFKKKGVRKPVSDKGLSDGEHQLLHILGTIMLMDTPGTLFILDEPETHFNPEWRAQFVSLLNECLHGEARQQEVILTSHSPFIVSDCKPEKVFSFYRGNRNKVEYKKPGFNTYGASVNLITMKIFGKKETISGLAQSELEEILDRYDRGEIDGEMAAEEMNKFGDSIEKTIFLSNLNKPEEQKI
ncbi:MAG: restriction system-associated AAA family ATPase [Proteobacteria bacterium]|nr:restriction system-associated AAA family ATPase [Pseudomonadota bacterium]MBU1716122.1 restriction system-associated AAA family ATPase [Pseudomonadota bacterium]